MKKNEKKKLCVASRDVLAVCARRVCTGSWLVAGWTVRPTRGPMERSQRSDARRTRESHSQTPHETSQKFIRKKERSITHIRTRIRAILSTRTRSEELSVVRYTGGFQQYSRWLKTGRKRKLLTDGVSLSPPDPLGVGEFQTHRRTRLDEACALSCLDLAYPWRFRRR